MKQKLFAAALIDYPPDSCQKLIVSLCLCSLGAQKQKMETEMHRYIRDIKDQSFLRRVGSVQSDGDSTEASPNRSAETFLNGSQV